jgi:hypothetical protein
MNDLRFTFNWNGNLFCKHIPTIRPYFKDKYKELEILKAWYVKGKKEFYLGNFMVLRIVRFKIEDLTEWDYQQLLGYNKETSIRVIKSMYKNSNFNWDLQQFCYLAMLNLDYDNLKERFHLMIDFEQNVKITQDT